VPHTTHSHTVRDIALQQHMSCYAAFLLGSAAVAGAMNLRLDATSFHQLSEDPRECTPHLQSCWQSPVKLHDELKGVDCSMKFRIEPSSKPGPGVPLKLTAESIGPDCAYGDYLKAYVLGPENSSAAADLRISKATKLAEGEFSVPLPGAYTVTIFHHYIRGTGEADINTTKSFSLGKLECGFDIPPACTAFSDGPQSRLQRSCDFQHDDPTEGFWQSHDDPMGYHKKIRWQPWACNVPTMTRADIENHPIFQVAIIGSSRPRSLYHDFLGLLNYTFESEPLKEQADMWHARAQPWHPDLLFMWGECKDDLDPGPDHGVLKSSEAYEKHFSSFAADYQLCASENLPTTVIFTIGICEIARSTMDSVKPYVRNVLGRVAQTCSKHRVIVVSEMAVHQENHNMSHDLTEEGTSNERIIMVNDVVRTEARKLGLEFLDAYKMTSSYYPNDSWDPLVHYFHWKKPSVRGNSASREIAKILMASVYRPTP